MEGPRRVSTRAGAIEGPNARSRGRVELGVLGDVREHMRSSALKWGGREAGRRNKACRAWTRFRTRAIQAQTQPSTLPIIAVRRVALSLRSRHAAPARGISNSRATRP